MCLNYYSSVAPFLLAALLLLLLLLQLQLLLLTVVVMMVMVNVLVVVLLLLELVGAGAMTLPSMVEATTSAAALGLVLGELGFALDGLGRRCQVVLGIIKFS
jgi:hypothetical protein